MPDRKQVWLGPILAALVAAASVVMIGLGLWQLQRLGERRADNSLIRSRLAQAPLLLTRQTGDFPEYTLVQASGAYDFANEIVLRNRAHDEVAGVHLLTPLRLQGSDKAVLVDRGWIPYLQADPAARARFDGPTGPVSILGITRASQARTFFLLPVDPTASPGAPRLDSWFWVNVPQIQGQVPYPLLPFFVEAAPTPDFSILPITGYDIDLSEGPHLSYAIQWFAFAAITTSGSLALWRRNRRHARAAAS